MPSALFAVLAGLLGAAAPAGPASQGDSLHAYLQAQFAEVRQDYPETTYQSAFADLNGDGRAEAIVYFSSSYFCGSGGCDVFVFTPDREGWRQVAEISLGRPPIRLLATRHRGWRDLGIFVAGGGARPHEAAVAFDGSTYQPNPTVPPARTVRRGTRAQVLISDDQPGRTLFD
ncbi:MAG TPA: hypothetical protein VGX37_10880 [Allosphingosinicella sp.]|nr:hypothetical protein [Allosphingosinicella sp.]